MKKADYVTAPIDDVTNQIQHTKLQEIKFKPNTEPYKAIQTIKSEAMLLSRLNAIGTRPFDLDGEKFHFLVLFV